MTNKAQLCLPLPLDFNPAFEPEHKQLVKQHWNVTFARQKRVSVYAKRIMARVLDQIKDDDLVLRDYYQMRLVDVIKGVEVSSGNVHTHIREALYELLHMLWEFKGEDETEWYAMHLLDTSKEHRVGYKNGVITIVLNPQLTSYFIQIAHYTKYQLDGYMNLRSWYSMRFFEMLSAFKKEGYWYTTIDKYRQMMDCWHELDKKGRVKLGPDGEPLMKYNNTALLLKKTVAEPLKELANTPCAFRVEEIREKERVGPGRPKIVALRFVLLTVKSEEIPSWWLENSTVVTVVQKLRKWKVTDKNMALYLEVIGTKRASELVREWMLKENSQKRIDNPAKYCNSVFIKVGKQYEEKLKQDVGAILNQPAD